MGAAPNRNGNADYCRFITPFHRDLDRPLADRLWELLNHPHIAKQQVQSKAGEWCYLRSRTITKREFTQHIADEFTLAVSAVYRKQALFLAWDIDENFQERLEAFSAVLYDHGMGSAAFATSGSEWDRGKIILTLARPIPQSQGVAFARTILEEAAKAPEFGDPKQVTVFPNAGSAAGNTCRILGRNRKRSQVGTEQVLSLTAEVQSDAVAFLRGVFPVAGVLLPTILSDSG